MFKLKETKLRNFSLKYANLFSFICECSFSNLKFRSFGIWEENLREGFEAIFILIVK